MGTKAKSRQAAVLGLVCGVTAGLATLLTVPESVVPNAASTPDTVAARWTQRARHGKLNYRAARPGHPVRHTAYPKTVRYNSYFRS